MDTRIEAWWDAVLAGDVGDPHPIYGERISVRVRGERLHVSGELDRQVDRDELLAQARARIGRGIRGVDASRLRVAEILGKPGLLDQTLVASFPDRATAELAQKFVIDHSRVEPREATVIDRASSAKLRDLLPSAFVEDARKRLNHGEALLVMRVDETDAFKVRALLDEETRSKWTIATPPEVAMHG